MCLDKQFEQDVIHLQWTGPYRLDNVNSLTGPTDYGVYQVYGSHPVYGSHVLIYIGKASKQNFATRINQESWVYNSDPDNVQIYFGRIHGWSTQPTGEEWEEIIDAIERLLICSHKPADNKQMSFDRYSERYQKLHILNWGNHRDLLPETSGLRYSSIFDDETGYHAWSE